MSQGFAKRDVNFTGSAQPVPSNAWVRNPEWLPMPAWSGQDRIVILTAIFPGANPVRFTVTGAFTVDWGDGSAPQNYASGAAAEKNLAWADYSPDTLTSLSYRQGFITITPQAGQTLTSLSASVRMTGFSGTVQVGWLDFECSMASPTTLLFSGSSYSQAFRYLERVKFNTPNPYSMPNAFRDLVSLRVVEGMTQPFAGENTFLGSGLRVAPACKPVATGGNGIFSGCTMLQDISQVDFSEVTTLASAFTATSIRSVNLNVPLVTSLAGAFTSCASLEEATIVAPLAASTQATFDGCSTLKAVSVNAPNSVNALQMFRGCGNLRSSGIATLTLGAITTANTMFGNCVSLTAAPSLNTASCTDFTSMFNNCANLTSVPDYTTTSAVTFAYMFSGCSRLVTPPNLNTATASDFSSMFFGCTSLVTGPAYDLTNASNVISMFRNCTSLISTPAYNTVNCTQFGTGTGNGMFNACSSLRSVGALQCGNATAVGANFLFGCTSLESIILTGLRVSVSLPNPTLMTGAALDALYTSLGTALPSQVITVTGSLGTASDTPSIATSKGWQVTGT